MPTTSRDRIANEAILEQALQRCSKLSVVLRSADSLDNTHSLASLRRYVGEVYSALWDSAMGSESVKDVIVYPQNLPNAAPEQWIVNRPELDCICSHDSICGWVSSSAGGRGVLFQEEEGKGMGGLDAHVEALNADRRERGLAEVKALHVEPWPMGASATFQRENNVLFMDDDDEDDDDDVVGDAENNFYNDNGGGLLGGARIPSKSLFNSVAVGGTFDGMHYGHRKLLTLAVSSVQPQTGKLLIGVTVDEMLRHKQLAELIPTVEERIEGVRRFVHQLAPGMKNRIRIVRISDAYGPPGSKENGDFDALVLSHETLETGYMLNQHRVNSLGLHPLVLLCTRRTEPNGMSSTALRKLRVASEVTRQVEERSS